MGRNGTNSMAKRMEIQPANATTVEDAAKLVEADRLRRRETCMREINEALKRHRCILDAMPTYVQDPSGNYSTQIKIALVPE